jgi:hypothetical protein
MLGMSRVLRQSAPPLTAAGYPDCRRRSICSVKSDDTRANPRDSKFSAMAEISFNTLAVGYLRAERRLAEARQATTTSSSELFIPLLEALSWVYALLLYDARSQHPHVPEDYAGALRFVRGRVQHAWQDAVEFRRDVLMPREPIGWQQGKHVYYSDPAVYADWCWRATSALPGQSGGDDEKHYDALLAEKSVAMTLGPFTDLIYNLSGLVTADVLAQPPRRS